MSTDDNGQAPAAPDLEDAFARVKAQVHVLRLASGAVSDEGDMRAVIGHLATIEDELRQAEAILRRRTAG